MTIPVGEPLRPGPDADPVAVTRALRSRIDDLLGQARDAYPQQRTRIPSRVKRC